MKKLKVHMQPWQTRTISPASTGHRWRVKDLRATALCGAYVGYFEGSLPHIQVPETLKRQSDACLRADICGSCANILWAKKKLWRVP